MVGESPSRFGETSSGRLHELDSLRGLAALGVVVYHYGSHFHVYPWETLLGPLYREAWQAVDFFFVLSGFVLCRAYWNDKRRIRLGSNTWDRVARLYPLHLVTLIAVAVGQLIVTTQFHEGPYVYQINDVQRFALNLLLLHGLDTSFNGPSWSISTEFLVNILFFFVILLRRRWATATMIVLMLATLLPNLTGLLSEGVPLLRTIRGFFFGVLLYSAVVKMMSPGGTKVSVPMNPVFVITVICTIVYGYLMSDYPRFSGGIMLLLFGLLVVSAPLSSLGNRWLGSSPLIFFGDISYSIYLVHFPLQLVLHLLAVTFGWSWPYQEPWFLAAFVGLTIACAHLTYRYIELPGKRWVRSLWEGRKIAVGSEKA